MNGINKVTDKIIAEAEAEAAAIKAKAEKRAAQAIADAEKAAEEKAAAIAAKADSDCAEISRRSVSVADLDKRKMTLAAKREVIDEVFEGIKKAVYALPSDKYAAFTVRLIMSAPAYPEITFASADKAVSEKILASLTAKSRKFASVSYTDKIDRGFILGDGAVRIDYSLGEILAAQRAELEPSVASALFPADKERGR